MLWKTFEEKGKHAENSNFENVHIIIFRKFSEKLKVVKINEKMLLIQIPEKHFQQIVGKFSIGSRQILTVAFDKLFIDRVCSLYCKTSKPRSLLTDLAIPVCNTRQVVTI